MQIIDWRIVNLILFTIAVPSAVFFTRWQIARAAQSEQSMLDSDFAGSERVLLWTLTILNPLLVGPIIYHGLQEKLPLKSRAANKISILVFCIEASLGIVYYFVVVRN